MIARKISLPKSCFLKEISVQIKTKQKYTFIEKKEF